MAMMGSGAASGEGRAREAAEAAIRSPLLEDVDLAGARGILVNLTAGPDMAIGEFEEVGNTVKEFAADEATVVVGTVIDEEMQDELRVTVVATGLGNTHARQVEPRVKIVRKPETGEIDYGELDKPTAIRRRPAPKPLPEGAAAAEMDYEYLDIPAFLRKQAD